MSEWNQKRWWILLLGFLAGCPNHQVRTDEELDPNQKLCMDQDFCARVLAGNPTRDDERINSLLGMYGKTNGPNQLDALCSAGDEQSCRLVRFFADDATSTTHSCVSGSVRDCEVLYFERDPNEAMAAIASHNTSAARQFEVAFRADPEETQRLLDEMAWSPSDTHVRFSQLIRERPFQSCVSEPASVSGSDNARIISACRAPLHSYLGTTYFNEVPYWTVFALARQASIYYHVSETLAEPSAYIQTAQANGDQKLREALLVSESCQCGYVWIASALQRRN